MAGYLEAWPAFSSLSSEHEQEIGYPSVLNHAPALFPGIEPNPLAAHAVDICVLQLGKLGQCGEVTARSGHQLLRGWQTLESLSVSS